MVKGQSYNTSNSCEVNVNAFPLDNVLNNQKERPLNMLRLMVNAPAP